MRPRSSGIALLLVLAVTSVCFAVPALTQLTAVNPGAGMATLVMKSSANGTGFFTLRSGSSVTCGTGTQVAFGPYSSGSYHGSLPLFANVSANYTVRNLKENTPYTVCFTAADNPSGSNLNPNPLFANISTSSVKTFSNHGWGDVGGAGFTPGTANFTSFAFSPDGMPYLAYVDANDGNRITVMRYRESSWGLVGGAGFAAGAANTASLAFAPDGTPHVAFVDAVTSFASVMRYYENAWSAVGTPSYPADTMATSLAFAPDGSPYLAYIDASTSLVSVIQYVGSDWNIVGGAGISAGGADFISLAVAPDGTPYVAYSDQDGVSNSNGKTTVMKYNGSAWVIVGSTGFSAGTASYVSLAFDFAGISYVAYQDGGTSNQATVMKFDGTSWADVGGAGFSTNAVSFTSLAIAPDGAPHLAFVDAATNYATVMRYNDSDSTWNELVSAGFSNGPVESTSLAFALDGSPYVAYRDDGNGSRATVMNLGIMPTISGTPPGTATVGQEYSFTPAYTDTTGYSVTNNLPPGLSLSAAGVMSGTPTTTGTFSSIIITATNSYGSASLPAFSITVTPNGTGGSVQLVSNSVIYSDIAAALTAANDDDTLKILKTINSVTVSYNGSGVVTLEGGYAADWNSRSGFSPVSSLTITGGTLIINQIEVQ